MPGTPYPQYQPPGYARPNVKPRSVTGIFAALMVGLIAAAVVIVYILTRPPVAPDCPTGQPCGGPPPHPDPSITASPPAGSLPPTPTPEPGGMAPQLVVGSIVTNDELGYSLEYLGNRWQVLEGSASRDLRLKNDWPEFGDPVLWIRGAPAQEATPDQLMSALLDEVRSQTIGLERDERPQNAILDPEIGYVRGIGATYVATVDTPQGVSKPALILVEAASDGRLSLAAALILIGAYADDTSQESETIKFRAGADMILNTVSWGSP